MKPPTGGTHTLRIDIHTYVREYTHIFVRIPRNTIDRVCVKRRFARTCIRTSSRTLARVAVSRSNNHCVYIREQRVCVCVCVGVSVRVHVYVFDRNAYREYTGYLGPSTFSDLCFLIQFKIN